MLIYVKKKNVFHRTDRRTDGRSTQNYSSEPHKKLFTGRQTDGQPKTIVRNRTKFRILKNFFN